MLGLSFPRLAGWLKRNVPAIVGLLCVTATFGVTLQLDYVTRQRHEMRFEAWIEKIHDNARDRIYNHTGLLHGLRGLFAASEEVTAAEFDRFVQSFDLPQRYPSIQGVGFALRTPPHAREAVVAQLRAQAPDLDIWPAAMPGDPPRTLYPTLYFCPVTRGDQPLLGFDISANPVAWDAMRRSRATLEAAASGDRIEVPWVRSVPAEGDARHFALYLPVFQEDFRHGHVTTDENVVAGYLYAIIDTDTYWGSIFHPISQQYFDISVYNGLVIDPTALEFSNGRAVPPSSGLGRGQLERAVTVDLAGRPWTLLFQSKPAFDAMSTRTLVVPMTFVAGLLGSLLLFGLARSQTLAWVTAREANAELERSQQRLREVNETLEQRVTERAAVAERRAAQVRRLSAEVTQIEQRERRQLARTLHDHLQQLLVAARLRLELLRTATSEADVQTMRQELDTLLGDAIAASRSLTIELSPPILHQSNLIECLQWLARHIRQQHRLAVDVQVVGDAALTNALVNDNEKIVLFESAREALLNVVKYAGVSEATVRVDYAPDDQMLELTVMDEGAGFEADKLALRGTAVERFGLFSIRERLELLDGELRIDSAPGAGTRVMFRLPAHEPSMSAS